MITCLLLFSVYLCFIVLPNAYYVSVFVLTNPGIKIITRDNSLLKDSISVKWRLRCILVFAERKQQQNRFAWYKQIYIDLCLTCALSGDNIQQIVVCCCVLDSLTPRWRYFLLYFLKLSNIFHENIYDLYSSTRIECQNTRMKIQENPKTRQAKEYS